MTQIAETFTNDHNQDKETGDVPISRKPADWDSFFIAVDKAAVPADFLDSSERQQSVEIRPSSI